MPRKVTRFACDFKCGHRVMPTAKIAEQHEATCWFNPENRTCKTCVNEIYTHQLVIHDEIIPPVKERWCERGCGHPIGERWMEANIESLFHAPTGQYLPRVNCAWYEQRL